jgi:hypothetical protein
LHCEEKKSQAKQNGQQAATHSTHKASWNGARESVAIESVSESLWNGNTISMAIAWQMMQDKRT